MARHLHDLTVNVGVVQPPAPSEPATRASGDAWREYRIVGPDTGFAALEQTLIACGPRGSGRRVTGSAEETLFVLEGTGTLTAGGAAYALEPESGASLPPHQRYELRGDGAQPLRILAVRIPAAEPPDGDELARPGAVGPVVVRRLSDQQAHGATAAREYRIVAGPEHGLRSATHFVGYIPTERAPDHFHAYDEVIYVLDGEGVFHAHGRKWPLSRGSCIQLPARTVHCLENVGGEVMRVLGVFRPAGSPAAAYYPDGTTAHPDAPPLGAS